MHKINEDKAQMLTDSAQLQRLSAEMLSVVPREGAGRGPSLLRAHAATQTL